MTIETQVAGILRTAALIPYAMVAVLAVVAFVVFLRERAEQF